MYHILYYVTRVFSILECEAGWIQHSPDTSDCHIDGFIKCPNVWRILLLDRWWQKTPFVQQAFGKLA